MAVSYPVHGDSQFQTLTRLQLPVCEPLFHQIANTHTYSHLITHALTHPSIHMLTYSHSCSFTYMVIHMHSHTYTLKHTCTVSHIHTPMHDHIHSLAYTHSHMYETHICNHKGSLCTWMSLIQVGLYINLFTPSTSHCDFHWN